MRMPFDCVQRALPHADVRILYYPVEHTWFLLVCVFNNEGIKCGTPGLFQKLPDSTVRFDSVSVSYTHLDVYKRQG